MESHRSFVNENEEIPEDNQWQDKCINVMDTYGMLNMLRYILIICMLIFSYVGHPPSEKNITDCNPTYQFYNKTVCKDTYNELVRGNKMTVYIVLVVLLGQAGTFFIKLFLYFTKYIKIILNTNGFKSGRGACATFIGFAVLAFILIRCFYCFASTDSQWRGIFKCANSNNNGMKILNNIWLQGIFTACMIILLILAIKLLKTKNYIEFKYDSSNNYNYYTSSKPYYNLANRIYISFVPPPAEGIPINPESSDKNQYVTYESPQHSISNKDNINV
jgi:hypothetical protein